MHFLLQINVKFCFALCDIIDKAKHSSDKLSALRALSENSFQLIVVLEVNRIMHASADLPVMAFYTKTDSKVIEHNFSLTHNAAVGEINAGRMPAENALCKQIPPSN